jgi:hypothetical protein
MQYHVGLRTVFTLFFVVVEVARNYQRLSVLFSAIRFYKPDEYLFGTAVTLVSTEET